MARARKYRTSDTCRTTVRGFNDRIRARTRSSEVPPTTSFAPTFKFGSNLHSYGTPLFADLTAGCTWQNIGNGYSYGPPPKDAPAGSSYYQTMHHPFADGEWHLFRWKEPGNTTGVSKWTRRFTNYQNDFSNTRMTNVTESYADGIFTSRFRYYSSKIEKNPSGIVVWNGQGTIELVDCLPEGFDRSDPFNPEYMAVSSKLKGNARALDLGGGNTWNQTWLWIERSRVDKELNKNSKQPTFALEHWRDFCIRTNRGLEWVIPHTMPESTVKALVVAMMTGVGFDDGLPLPSHLPLFVELCDNEPWNPGLTGAYQALAKLGVQMGYTGNNENGARLYAQAKRSIDVARWIREAVPEHMHRIVRIVGLSPHNDRFDYDDMRRNGLTDFEAVTKALYMGFGLKQNFGGNTPAEIAVEWAKDAARQTDLFIRNADAYRADGYRVLCYEVGSDTADVPWTARQRADFLYSPEFYEIYYTQLSRVAVATNDNMNLYWDMGPYYDEVRTSGWGHYQGRGLPSQKMDIALRVQSEYDQLRMTGS